MTQIKKPRVLFFNAGWSGPCVAYRKVIEACLEAYKDQFLPLESYDTDSVSEALLRQWRVLGVPTTIVVSRYDRELIRLTGYNTKDYTLNALRKGVL
jgi:thioredoxin-like negative regulator of GroEL